jgi:hypothetical protein
MSTGNTISNLGMIVPPLFGIYEILKLGLEKKFILTYLFLIGKFPFPLSNVVST